MKKLIITAIAVSAVVSSALSQGTVGFATGATASNRISTNSVAGGPATGANAAVANSFYFALFASTSQTAINGVSTAVSGVNANYVFNNMGGGTVTNGWILVGIGVNTASVGRFAPQTQGTSSSSQGALNGDGSLNVVGTSPGGTANFVSVGWSANVGSTLAAMMAAYSGGNAMWIGQSAVGVGLPLGDGGSLAANSSMGVGTGQVGGYTLGITTPEPGTLALAALGGASLLMFRRKK